jgi:hypothetical protein
MSGLATIQDMDSHAIPTVNCQSADNVQHICLRGF